MTAKDLLLAARTLFPDSEVSLGRVDRRQTNALRLVPPGERAKLAIPAGAPLAAARTISRPSAGDSIARALFRESLAAAERTRVLGCVTRAAITIDHIDGSIVQHLSEVFRRRVVVGLMVGSARANRKPVLNVFAEDGSELGFAKVGLGELANKLVSAEAQALGQLGGLDLRQMQIPRVISAEPWRGSSTVVLSPLRSPRLQRGMALPVAALDELAASAGIPRALALGASAWGQRLSAQLDHGVADTPLPSLISRTLERYGAVEWSFGPWHGDFGPWNMLRTSSIPMVWDWERFDTQMPVGLDALHFTIHRELASKVGDALPIDHLLSAAAHVLAAQRIDSPDKRSTMVPPLLAAYLLTYAARFVGEGLAHGVPRTTSLGLRYAGHLERLLEADV